MTDVTPTPSGVVAIFTDPDGYVIASVSDFDSSGYGGFSRRQAQEMRVRDALNRAVINAYCSDRIAPFIEKYDAQGIIDRMMKNGWKRTIIPVGHSE